MRKLIVYLMGPTCSGKSKLVEAAQSKWGKELGVVQVGQALRKLHPPEYFAGQGNPEHVHQEAMSIYHKLLDTALDNQDVGLVLVDGQPRNGQIDEILSGHKNHLKVFVHLDASTKTRIDRVKIRSKTPAECDLAFKRIDNDRLMSYDVIVDLLKRKIDVFVEDTEQPLEVWAARALQYINAAYRTYIRVN